MISEVCTYLYSVYVSSIIFLVSFLVLFYQSYKYNTAFSKISITCYFKITIFSVVQNALLKYFDWLKFILIIGALSILETQNHDVYLSIIIKLSYVALLFDSYIFSYNSYYNIFCKPTYGFLDTLDKKLGEADNTVKESNVLLNEGDKLLNETNDLLKELNKHMDKKDLLKIEVNLDTLRLQKSLDKLKEHITSLRKHSEDSRKAASSLKKFLPIYGLLASAITTYFMYILIDHLVHLYIYGS